MGYGTLPTPKKPAPPLLDKAPEVWHHRGEPVNLFEQSQQPWNAGLWKARREAKDKEALAAAFAKKEGDGKGSGKVGQVRKSFDKLDLVAVILERKLFTKAKIEAYAQKHGHSQMQRFVSKHQRKLDEIIEDAQDWQKAQEVALDEDITDWERVEAAAKRRCGAEQPCLYRDKFQEILDDSGVSMPKLAWHLKRIIQHDPAKHVKAHCCVWRPALQGIDAIR